CHSSCRRLFAADLFFENFHVPRMIGKYGEKRPLGPLGIENVQQSSATFGLSRFATDHAEGGFMIIEPWPEIRYLLFDASSQAKTSGGMYLTSCCMYSSTCLTASFFFTRMLPFASTRSAPNEWNNAPTQSMESVVWPRPSPIGWPTFWSLGAALRSVSHVQFSASAVGFWPAGYIAWKSMPAASFQRLNRAHGG